VSQEEAKRPGTGELSDIVHGPLTDRTESTLLGTLHDEYTRRYQQAVDRGDPREIEDAEQQLSGLVDTHPELRNQ
jgi:nitroimidazol reductase NimA-like FMN-containing flavoprotein (pyridoxamine 5'-phosphate oxidase superfamily)